MNAVSMNNLWAYLQGLSLTASNRKWQAERLIEVDRTTPPVLHTLEGALSALAASADAVEGGDVRTDEECTTERAGRIDSFAV